MNRTAFRLALLTALLACGAAHALELKPAETKAEKAAEKSSDETPVRWFGKADADHDGTVTKKEYLADAQAKAEKRFAKIDVNHDGKITKDEAEKSRSKRKAKKAKI